MRTAMQNRQRVENAIAGLSSADRAFRRASAGILRHQALMDGLLALVSPRPFRDTVAGIIGAQPLPEVKLPESLPAVVAVNQSLARVDSMFLGLTHSTR